MLNKYLIFTNSHDTSRYYTIESTRENLIEDLKKQSSFRGLTFVNGIYDDWTIFENSELVLNQVFKSSGTYKYGDKFKTEDGLIYMLVQSGSHTMILVCIDGAEDKGNRWADPVKVSNVVKITQSEFKRIASTLAASLTKI